MTFYTARPIDVWPGKLRTARTSNNFSASWADTLDLLERELRALDGRRVVMMLALRESELRADGGVRADARPYHPGVVIAFDSRHGPLKYATDRFDGGGRRHLAGWQANVRAVALGLEALRRVDRYGITKSGEQYAGWRAIEGGARAMPAGDGFATVEDAARFLADHAEHYDAGDFLTAPGVAANAGTIERGYRAAAKHLHPDAGGDADLFRRLGEARAMLLR